MLGIQLNSDAYVERLQSELGRVDRQAMQRWADHDLPRLGTGTLCLHPGQRWFGHDGQPHERGLGKEHAAGIVIAGRDA